MVNRKSMSAERDWESECSGQQQQQQQKQTANSRTTFLGGRETFAGSVDRAKGRSNLYRQNTQVWLRERGGGEYELKE